MGTFTGSSLWQLEIQVFPEQVLDATYILDMGFKRFRFGISYLDSLGVDWGKPELSIHPSHDEFITTLANNGIKLTFVPPSGILHTGKKGERYPYPDSRQRRKSNVTSLMFNLLCIISRIGLNITKYGMSLICPIRSNG